MKILPNFTIRDICGEKVLVPSGIEHIDFGALIHLNATAADILQHFQNIDFEVDDIVNYLVQEYDVTESQARSDVEQLLTSLIESKIVER